MRVHILGYYGGSFRYPGAASGYMIEDGEDRILLDMGSGVLSMLQKRSLMDFHHVYLSHFHADHYADYLTFIHHRLITNALGETSGEVTVYCPDDERRNLLEKDGVSRTVEITPAFRAGGFELTTLRTAHPIPTYAVRVEKDVKSIVYTADAGLTDDLIAFADGTDLLITECSLPLSMPKMEGHLRVDEARLLIEAAAPKQTLITHLPIYGGVTREDFCDLEGVLIADEVETVSVE